MAFILPMTGTFYHSMPCGKLEFILEDQSLVLESYPICEAFFSGENPTQHASVRADLSTDGAEAAAVLDMVFGSALWLGIIIHVVGVELYVSFHF
jgi:hypothetical protein